MPQKRILTKKGVISSPTVVNANVNAPPEVIPASRITRIPIPKGSKVPIIAEKDLPQPNAAIPATITTTDSLVHATAVSSSNTATTTTIDLSSSDASTVASSTASLADWAIDFQVQLRAMNTRFAAYENRLNEVERLTAENAQLKFALSDAHQLIATLQEEVKRLNNVSVDAVMSDVSGVALAGVSGVSASGVSGNSGDSDGSGVSDGAAGATASGNSGASGVSGVSGVSGMPGAASGVSSGSFFAGNSSVSKYASLPATTAASSTRVAATTATPTYNFLAAAKKGKNSKQKSKSKPSPQKVEAAARFFSDYPEQYEQGYRYIYFRSRHRKSYKTVREQLHTLKVQNWRVLDIHYPAPKAVALLVHHEYAKELLDTLAKAKVLPIEAFDPRDPTILEDPRLVSLIEAERVEKVIQVHQGRLLRGLQYLYQHAGRRPISIAVATDFFHKNWISDAQLREFKSTDSFTIDGVVSGDFGSGDSGSGDSGSGSDCSGSDGSGSGGDSGAGGVFETDNENVTMTDAANDAGSTVSASLPGGDKPEASQ